MPVGLAGYSKCWIGPHGEPAVPVVTFSATATTPAAINKGFARVIHELARHLTDQTGGAAYAEGKPDGFGTFSIPTSCD